MSTRLSIRGVSSGGARARGGGGGGSFFVAFFFFVLGGGVVGGRGWGGGGGGLVQLPVRRPPRVAVHYGYDDKGRLTGERQTVENPETGELLWQHETGHAYSEQGLANRVRRRTACRRWSG